MQLLSKVFLASLAMAVVAAIAAKPTEAQLAKMHQVLNEMNAIFKASFESYAKPEGSHLETHCKGNGGNVMYVPIGDVRCSLVFRPAANDKTFNLNATLTAMAKSVVEMGPRTNYWSVNHCNDAVRDKHNEIVQKGGAVCTFHLFPAMN